MPELETIIAAISSKKQSSKTIWRARMLETRSELGPEKASQLNRELCKNLAFIWGEAPASAKGQALWAGYKVFRWEADPEQAIAESSRLITWVYPRVVEQTTEMEFFKPFPTDAVWLKNKWGIWEPDPRTAEKVDLNDCGAVLVPGIAFDRKGRRLGYGKGFYDRALAGFKGLKVGVCFSLQIISEPLPTDDLDVNMDLIVTDSEIIRVNRSRH